MIPLPDEYLSQLHTLLPEDYDAFLASYNRPSYRALRINTLKAHLDEEALFRSFSLSPIPWSDSGFYYPETERPGKHPYHDAGVYYLQEPSAMAVAEALSPQENETVLDLCAAPGGKSTAIAALMNNTGLLFANEIHPKRAKILSQNIERCGIANTVVLNETPERLAQRFPAFFDRVLVDAPCSGEGMFRKNPDAVAEWSTEQVTLCAARQNSIMQSAVQLVKPGGVLVYSTCTFSFEENEAVINNLLTDYPDFSLETVPHSDCFSPGITGTATQDMSLCRRLWPHRLKGEGHFIARLRRDGQLSVPPAPPISGDFPSSYQQFIKEFMKVSPKGRPLFFGSELYAAPVACPDLSGIKVLRPGLHLGTVKKNYFEPAHALALTMTPEKAVFCQNYSADSADIKHYLQGLSLWVPADQKGWCLVCADGYGLGWGKSSGGQLKNHYPKGLRWLS